MDGMDKILERISADAQAEADRILAQARDQAREIRERYALQAQREAQAILERGRREAARLAERLDGAAQLERGRAELAAKQEMVEEAFRLALKELRELPREDYVSLLVGLAARASSTGREELIFSQTDRATVGKAVEGGFVLRGDGMEVNCGLAAMLRWERERLAVDVAGVLFP